MPILYVLCIGWVLDMQEICIDLIGLCVQMFIPSVNEHCGHYFIVIVVALCLSHMQLQVFLHTMMILCCYVSGDSCSYISRAYQILELGVSEFCSTVLNSYFNSRVYFRVLSRNSQRGRLYGWILSTILLALFRAKFACILAISNPIFRWESCKGS